MLHILFGWRKASKCKKLIRRVERRVKLLKNKRCCIAKQLKEDITQLLKNGHEQAAFERVEQLAKDNSMVETYDLLHHFCEFIKTKMRYIRRHKDCPNDINEAVSTLIFLSARFGDIPELLCIRNLFEERYGRGFVVSALELLPGNHVNIQIIQNLEMKTVPDGVKLGLLNELASCCMGLGPLFLEYNVKSSRTLSGDREIAINLEPIKQHESSDSCKEPHIYAAKEEPCPEISVKPSQDIEEIVSPVSKDGNLQEQSLFLFRSCRVIQPEETNNYVQIDEDLDGHGDSSENFTVRISRKTRKASRKRSRRRRSSSRDNISSINDIECATYYGEVFAHRRKKIYAVKEKIRSSMRNEDADSIEEGEEKCKETEEVIEEGEDKQSAPLRAMTMPNERVKERFAEKILSSNTVPFEQARNAKESSCRHIHPKLPDYDELAAKFVALKKETLKKKKKLHHLENEPEGLEY